MGKTANPEPTTRSDEKPASSPAALVSFVQLLARHAAHEVFTAAQSASASDPEHIEPEDTHEAED